MRFPVNIFGKKDTGAAEDGIHVNTMNPRSKNVNINNNMNINTNRNLNTSDVTKSTPSDNPSFPSRFLPPSPPKSQSVPNSPRTHRFRRSGNKNTDTTNNVNSNNKVKVNNRVQIPMSDSISNANVAESFLDINSNIAFKHRESLEDSSDWDNDNDVIKRRTSFKRSDSTPSVEDSGFSSCNCLCDDKDDMSVNTSFDCDDSSYSNGCQRDSLPCVQHPFSLSSLTRRARTYSIDSTSSDLSDSTTPALPERDVELSASLPLTYIQNPSANSERYEENAGPSATSENSNLSPTGIVKRRSFRNKSRRNGACAKPGTDAGLGSSRNNIATGATITTSATIAPHRPAHTSDDDDDVSGTDTVHNDHNNNLSDFPCKNLSSSIDAAIPFRFADLFQSHGLITLLACIFYTVFLIFVCGGFALSWTILKKYVNKSDLKDLRENMLESRRGREIVTARTADRMGRR